MFRTFFPKPVAPGEMAELRGRPMDDLELSKESVFQGGILGHFLAKHGEHVGKWYLKML